jgi:hypothetical protein
MCHPQRLWSPGRGHSGVGFKREERKARQPMILSAQMADLASLARGNSDANSERLPTSKRHFINPQYHGADSSSYELIENSNQC